MMNVESPINYSGTSLSDKFLIGSSISQIAISETSSKRPHPHKPVIASGRFHYYFISFLAWLLLPVWGIFRFIFFLKIYQVPETLHIPVSKNKNILFWKTYSGTSPKCTSSPNELCWFGCQIATLFALHAISTSNEKWFVKSKDVYMLIQSKKTVNLQNCLQNQWKLACVIQSVWRHSHLFDVLHEPFVKLGLCPWRWSVYATI